MRFVMHTGPQIGEERLTFFIRGEHAFKLAAEVGAWFTSLPGEIQQRIRHISIIPKNSAGHPTVDIKVEFAESYARYERAGNTTAQSWQASSYVTLYYHKEGFTSPAFHFETLSETLSRVLRDDMQQQERSFREASDSVERIANLLKN